MNPDMFTIVAEAEMSRLSRLMNRASSAYWKLKDRQTPYAIGVYATYLMNRRAYDSVLETLTEYRQGKILGEE